MARKGNGSGATPTIQSTTSESKNSAARPTSGTRMSGDLTQNLNPSVSNIVNSIPITRNLSKIEESNAIESVLSSRGLNTTRAQLILSHEFKPVSIAGGRGDQGNYVVEFAENTSPQLSPTARLIDLQNQLKQTRSDTALQFLRNASDIDITSLLKNYQKIKSFSKKISEFKNTNLEEGKSGVSSILSGKSIDFSAISGVRDYLKSLAEGMTSEEESNVKSEIETLANEADVIFSDIQQAISGQDEKGDERYLGLVVEYINSSTGVKDINDFLCGLVYAMTSASRSLDIKANSYVNFNIPVSSPGGKILTNPDPGVDSLISFDESLRDFFEEDLGISNNDYGKLLNTTIVLDLLSAVYACSYMGSSADGSQFTSRDSVFPAETLTGGGESELIDSLKKATLYSMNTVNKSGAEFSATMKSGISGPSSSKRFSKNDLQDIIGDYDPDRLGMLLDIITRDYTISSSIKRDKSIMTGVESNDSFEKRFKDLVGTNFSSSSPEGLTLKDLSWVARNNPDSLIAKCVFPFSDDNHLVLPFERTYGIEEVGDDYYPGKRYYIDSILGDEKFEPTRLKNFASDFNQEIDNLTSGISELFDLKGDNSSGDINNISNSTVFRIICDELSKFLSNNDFLPSNELPSYRNAIAMFMATASLEDPKVLLNSITLMIARSYAKDKTFSDVSISNRKSITKNYIEQWKKKTRVAHTVSIKQFPDQAVKDAFEQYAEESGKKQEMIAQWSDMDVEFPSPRATKIERGTAVAKRAYNDLSPAGKYGITFKRIEIPFGSTSNFPEGDVVGSTSEKIDVGEVTHDNTQINTGLTYYQMRDILNNTDLDLIFDLPLKIERRLNDIAGTPLDSENNYDGATSGSGPWGYNKTGGSRNIPEEARLTIYWLAIITILKKTTRWIYSAGNLGMTIEGNYSDDGEPEWGYYTGFLKGWKRKDKAWAEFNAMEMKALDIWLRKIADSGAIPQESYEDLLSDMNELFLDNVDEITKDNIPIPSSVASVSGGYVGQISRYLNNSQAKIISSLAFLRAIGVNISAAASNIGSTLSTPFQESGTNDALVQFFKNSEEGRKLIAFSSPDQVATNDYLIRYLGVPGSQYTHLPAMKSYSTAQIKNMIKFFNLPGFNFLPNEANGNLSVFAVGIPAGCIGYLRDKAASAGYGSKYSTSSLIRIKIERMNLQRDEEESTAQEFVFDMSKYIIEGTLGTQGGTSLTDAGGNDKDAETETNDASRPIDVIASTKISTINVISEEKYYETTGKAYKESSRINKDIKNKVFFNIAMDHYLKMYLKMTSGIEVGEDIFQINEMKTLYEGVDPGKSDLFKELMKKNLTSYPSANLDINVATEFNRIKSECSRSILFNGKKYANRMIMPKIFDRVFCLLVDEGDFKVKTTSTSYMSTSGESGSSFYQYFCTIDLLKDDASELAQLEDSENIYSPPDPDDTELPPFTPIQAASETIENIANASQSGFGNPFK